MNKNPAPAPDTDRHQVPIEVLKRFLESAGFAGAEVRAEGDLMVIRLPENQRGTLLADEALRKALVAESKTIGFSRVALEIGLSGAEA